MSELLTFIPAVVAIVLVGWFLKRIGFMGPSDVDILNKVIIYISLPALIFLTVQSSKLTADLIKMPFYAFAVMAAGLVAAYLAGKILKLPPALMGAFLLVAAFGNTGYLGFSLTIGLLGQSQLVKSVFYDFGTVTLIFSAGIMIAGYFGDPEHKTNVIREFVTFPSIIALVAGLLFHPLPLPAFLVTGLKYLSAATIPLIMLTIGLTLEAKKLNKYAVPLTAVVVLKLLLAPVFGYLAARAGGLPPADFNIVVLESSMPAAMLSLVIGLKYKLDTEFIALAILTSIIASLGTILLVQAVLNALGY